MLSLHPEFLKWIFPSLNVETSTASEVSVENKMASSVDPDETAHSEPSHLELQVTKVSSDLVCLCEMYEHAQRRFRSACALAQSDQNLH